MPVISEALILKRRNRLKTACQKDIKAIGVFVDEDKKYIDYYIKNNIIDIVQLHATKSLNFAKALTCRL